VPGITASTSSSLEGTLLLKHSSSLEGTLLLKHLSCLLAAHPMVTLSVGLALWTLKFHNAED
jgi:hypothetical protein